MTLVSNVQNWWQARFTSRAAYQLSDEQLLLQYADDTKTYCLELLIERHSDALYHFLISLSDSTLAEDITQQTWLKIIERPNRFIAKNATFRTWLFTTGRNALIDELRRKNRWQWQAIEDTPTDELEDWQNSLNVTDQGDIQQRFDDALVALSFPQKEALMLQLEGFSLSDIADITHEKSETIKSRLRFARKAIKEKMEAES